MRHSATTPAQRHRDRTQLELELELDTRLAARALARARVRKEREPFKAIARQICAELGRPVPPALIERGRR